MKYAPSSRLTLSVCWRGGIGSYTAQPLSRCMWDGRCCCFTPSCFRRGPRSQEVEKGSDCSIHKAKLSPPQWFCLKWAAVSTIVLIITTVEERSWIKPRSVCLPALPLDLTGLRGGDATIWTHCRCFGLSTSLQLQPIIIIMEICKAPTLRLKALNKHSINTHNVHRDGNVISNKNRYNKQNKKGRRS